MQVYAINLMEQLQERITLYALLVRVHQNSLFFLAHCSSPVNNFNSAFHHQRPAIRERHLLKKWRLMVHGGHFSAVSLTTQARSSSSHHPAKKRASVIYQRFLLRKLCQEISWNWYFIPNASRLKKNYIPKQWNKFSSISDLLNYLWFCILLFLVYTLFLANVEISLFLITA